VTVTEATTPDPRRIRAVQRRLRRHQGAFIPKPRLPIIDEVVATVLSQHTSCDTNARQALVHMAAGGPFGLHEDA
jgi:hypothetical protein